MKNSTLRRLLLLLQVILPRNGDSSNISVRSPIITPAEIAVYLGIIAVIGLAVGLTAPVTAWHVLKTSLAQALTVVGILIIPAAIARLYRSIKERRVSWQRSVTLLGFGVICVCVTIVLASITGLPGQSSIKSVGGSPAVRYVSRPASPTITIDQPTPGALVGARPSISGSVTNLGETQYVWMFSQPFSTSQPYRPFNEIGPYEQCTVSNNRTRFVCSQAFNGELQGDYCRMALLWVSVVDGSQTDNLRSAAQQGINYSRAWPSPPFTGKSADDVLVQRSPAPGQTCPGRG